MGIVSWNDMSLQAKNLFSSRTADRVIAGIAESEVALAMRNTAHFLSHLPTGDRVRLYPLLQDRILFLDLETTGLNSRRDRVTTAVTYDGQKLRAFVRDENLDALGPHLQQAHSLVTFNGRRFDLCFLRSDLGIRLPQPHLDLCVILRARHLCGGLKHIEQLMGVARPHDQVSTGEDAPALWARWRAGDSSALQQLLVYNAHDTLVLERLLIAALNLSMAACPAFANLPQPRQPFPNPVQLMRDSSLTS